MPNTAPTINGIAYMPERIQETRATYGPVFVAFNGAKTARTTGTKKKFTIPFSNLTAAQVAALDALAQSRTSFSFVLPRNGVTYTVAAIDEEPFTNDHDSLDSTDTWTYTAELRVEEV